MALSAEQFADLRRWAISAAIVVLAHGAIAAGMVTWREEIEPVEPAAAIVVEFAPLPVAPDAPPTEIAPGPEQVMSEASPERPVEHVEDEQKIEEKVASKPVEEPPPEIKPAPNPDVAIEPRPERPLYLTVKSDLTLALGDNPISRDLLRGTLDAAANGDKDTRVFLRADKAVPYGEMMEVMNLLRAAGYLKVALVGLEKTQ